MDKYQNKYRIPSARLQHWDYGNNGAYFITICTQNREHYFGDVVNGEMQLNELGQLAEKYWMEIPQHFSFIELGNFVVMPNHTHGILIIDKMNDDTQNVSDTPNDDTPNDDTPNVETPNLGVSTHTTHTTHTAHTHNGGKNDKWKPNTIGSIINQYKRIVTINARKIHADFGWQSRFHDHIIRDAQSFETISNYIINNPKKWAEDKFYV